MPNEKGKGQVLNHSSKELLILETDSGPPVVHYLGPKRKSPESVDADGFKRMDGQAILLHSGWWKVPDGFKADIYQVGDNVLIPVSVMAPFSDQHFGKYEIRQDSNWGEKLTYVTGILKDRRGRTTAYVIDGRSEVSVADAVMLARAGKIDNVIVVTNKTGRSFLRTKRNPTVYDNLTG